MIVHWVADAATWTLAGVLAGLFARPFINGDLPPRRKIGDRR